MSQPGDFIRILQHSFLYNPENNFLIKELNVPAIGMIVEKTNDHDSDGYIYKILLDDYFYNVHEKNFRLVHNKVK